MSPFTSRATGSTKVGRAGVAGLGQFSAKHKFCKEAFIQERQVLILQAKVSATSPFPWDKDATLAEESLGGLSYPGNCHLAFSSLVKTGPGIY